MLQLRRIRQQGTTRDRHSQEGRRAVIQSTAVSQKSLGCVKKNNALPEK